jgi:uncharacterized cupin superfamily protein
MRRANIFDTEVEFDPADPPGYRGGAARLASVLGAQELSVNVFEIPSGESLCPYHYEYVEEWLLVLEGELLLRVPDGEEHLGRGDAICFPPGPDGAHKVTNRSDAPSRIVMFSSAGVPAVAVYPDSDKIGVWTGSEADDFMLRRADGHVGYYEGEV